MGIVFDEVVGNVSQGEGDAAPAIAPDQDAEHREPTIDREALDRELRVMRQRAARLCAD